MFFPHWSLWPESCFRSWSRQWEHHPRVSFSPASGKIKTSFSFPRVLTLLYISRSLLVTHFLSIHQIKWLLRQWWGLYSYICRHWYFDWTSSSLSCSPCSFLLTGPWGGLSTLVPASAHPFTCLHWAVDFPTGLWLLALDTPSFLILPCCLFFRVIPNLTFRLRLWIQNPEMSMIIFWLWWWAAQRGSIEIKEL